MVDRVSQSRSSLQVVHYDPWLTTDGKQAGRLFGVGAIPAWFVYDRTGKLVISQVGALNDTQLDRTLKDQGI